MTREELKRHCEKQIEACEMWAKYNGEEPHGKVYEEHKLILELLEQQPCEDAISRQEVLDALDKSKYSNAFCEEHHIDWSINLGMAHIVVNELKPVTPQPKTGRWRKVEHGLFDSVSIRWECSLCKKSDRFRSNYCPNCGAKMGSDVRDV